jgi:hypothetical protein
MYENYVQIFQDHYITIELEKNEYILTNNATKDKSKLKIADKGFELEALPKASAQEPQKTHDTKDVQH